MGGRADEGIAADNSSYSQVPDCHTRSFLGTNISYDADLFTALMAECAVSFYIHATESLSVTLA